MNDFHLSLPLLCDHFSPVIIELGFHCEAQLCFCAELLDTQNDHYIKILWLGPGSISAVCVKMRKWVFLCSKSEVTYILLLKMVSCSRKRYLLKIMSVLYLRISQLIDETWNGLPSDITKRSWQVTSPIHVLDLDILKFLRITEALEEVQNQMLLNGDQLTSRRTGQACCSRAHATKKGILLTLRNRHYLQERQRRDHIKQQIYGIL